MKLSNLYFCLLSELKGISFFGLVEKFQLQKRGNFLSIFKKINQWQEEAEIEIYLRYEWIFTYLDWRRTTEQRRREAKQAESHEQQFPRT